MAQDRDRDMDGVIPAPVLPASPSGNDPSSTANATTPVAPSAAQLKRPPLGSHKESDSHSDTTASTLGAGGHKLHHRRQHTGPKHHHQRHVGKLGSRVTSSKALHKQGGQPTHQVPPGAKLTRRITSPTGSQLTLGQRQQSQTALSGHRRAHSEAKIPKNISGTKLPKSSSHNSLKRNQSAGEVSRSSNKSADKLKRASSGTGLSRQNHRPKSSKSSVHFALGDDEDDIDGSDEWVDASGSNSPYLSRKGSFNSTTQSPLRRSASSSRPETPNDQAKKLEERGESSSEPSTEDRERTQHKEYITSRLLQRVPSSGAPPKMTADVARATPRTSSPDSTSDRGAAVAHTGSSGRDELTSRFVDTSASALTSQNSFYPNSGSASGPRSNLNHDAISDSVSTLALRSEDLPRRPNSMANLSKSRDSSEGVPYTREPENSALVPRAGRRTGQAAETSRIQQKLNLQRASSVIEPGQGPVGVQGAERSTPIIGIGGPGYDGGHSRDPRVGKLLERTGMEYLVVRRYQNPIARSLNRLSYLPGASHSGSNSLLDMKLTLPRTNTGSTTGRRSADPPARQHARNVSMPNPEFRRPTTPTASANSTSSASRRATPKGSVVGGTTLDGGGTGDEESRTGAEGLSGSDLTEEEDSTAILLRHMWEKTYDLSASQD